MMSRELSIEDDGGLLTLSGSLTIEHGRQLLEALRSTNARGSQIRVSLAEVEDLDAAGLQILYAARAEALRDSKEFTWTALSAACGEVAEIAGMSQILGFPEPAGAAQPR
jgi:anti-anti-sigma regulatory factor